VAKTLREYCIINKFPGITKECVDSAFQSNDDKIVAQAKRYKLSKLTKEE
tara:strand:+ start:4522 stop:4671 length:150 start_codon:yes stop_codon:yes gene_type:complete